MYVKGSKHATSIFLQPTSNGANVIEFEYLIKQFWLQRLFNYCFAQFSQVIGLSNANSFINLRLLAVPNIMGR